MSRSKRIKKNISLMRTGASSIEAAAQIADAHDTLKMLSPREEKVLKLSFGTIDGIERGATEVGEQFGISRSRVRSIKKKALRKLSRIASDVPSTREENVEEA